MPTSFAIMAATADPTLTERAVAIAATIPDLSEQKVRSRIRELVTTPLEGGTDIATVYEYAQTLRDESLRAREAAVREAEDSHPIHLEPGLNPAAVTDDLIRAALTRLFLTT